MFWDKCLPHMDCLSSWWVITDLNSSLKNLPISWSAMTYHSCSLSPSLEWAGWEVVQSIKQALKASAYEGRTLLQRLCSFLLTYQTTAHATTGVSPCFLFVKRDLHTRLDSLRPSRTSHVLHKQSMQKDSHDRKAQDRSWYIGQTVHVRNLQPGPDWITWVIVERLGPLSYLVEMETHQFWKHRVDQLKEVVDSPLVSDKFRVLPDWDYTEPTPSSVNVPLVLPRESITESDSTARSSANVADPPPSDNLCELILQLHLNSAQVWPLVHHQECLLLH